MINLLVIVVIDALMDDKAIGGIKTDVHEQICDGVLVKHNPVSKIILIDKETGKLVVEV